MTVNAARFGDGHTDAKGPFKGKGAPGDEIAPALRDWVAGLGLPFGSMRAAHERLRELEQRREDLGAQARMLISAFRRRFPHGAAPAYLARSTDRALTPLRWRVSTAADGSDARKRFEVDSDLGRRLLGALSPAVREVFMDFEYKRIHVNFAITTTQYEIERLRDYIAHLTTWLRVENQG